MKARSPLVVGFLTLVSASVIAATALEAQSETGFADRRQPTLRAMPFSDRELTSAVATLDRLLASEKDRAKWGAHAKTVVWNFARHLQTGQLTPAQESQVLRHLDAIAALHPDDAQTFARARFMMTALMVGKPAPDIVGKDLDGVEFKLSDYRGKVVVLTFSAEWCGICRTLYPYQRFMVDLYKNWPFALLGVETGSSVSVTKQMKADAGLPYRAWWDAPGENAPGAIATAWNVDGFPTSYLIDGAGVIRFVDLRYEDLLKGVRQLLLEEPVAVRAAPVSAPSAKTSNSELRTEKPSLASKF